VKNLPKIVSDMKEEIKYEIIGICVVAVAVFALVSLFSAKTGSLGGFFARVLTTSFGKLALVVPVSVGFVGLALMVKRQPLYITQRGMGFVLAYCCMLGFLHAQAPIGDEFLSTELAFQGGYAGAIIITILRIFFGHIGSYLFLGALVIIAILLITDRSLVDGFHLLKGQVSDNIDTFKDKWQTRESEVEDYDETEEMECENTAPSSRFVKKNPLFLASELVDDRPRLDVAKVIPFPETARQKLHGEQQTSDMRESEPKSIKGGGSYGYQLPPLGLLKKSGKLKSGKPSKEITDNSRILEETLESFGVSAKVIDVSQGPAITRYELQPAPGVKVSRIVNLADDIALKLAATGVRIEAPIPGKAAVGIEVPNKDVSAVALRDVLESPEFQQAPSKLTVALGRDIAGTPIIADLGKMPHLLVAGATGSGKSVCINTLILSVLFKAAPHEVKFLLIDPKVVELSTFNGIPHLMTPVVTDPKKAASALRWAVNEMEKRYQLFAAAGVREIKRYNEVVPAENRIPYIIVIIDELADLMMVAPVDVEDAICRLAQMARAAGIHLVLATQRPSVDVITGIIKANIPSRISFAVSSQVDSRTILDMAGAEKLLGKGDMLFYPVGAPKPQRVQGAFVSDNEVEEAVDFTKRQAEPSFEENVFNVEVEAINGGCEASDDLLDDAIRLVLESGQASISMLQRRFRIGYSRAARLIDMMEQMRIVGPNIGSKAREIIATAETLQGRLQKK
jgi:DNA segregation ATPase FtsK/SpoIIIE, S-DNA-T family